MVCPARCCSLIWKCCSSSFIWSYAFLLHFSNPILSVQVQSHLAKTRYWDRFIEGSLELEEHFGSLWLFCNSGKLDRPKFLDRKCFFISHHAFQAVVHGKTHCPWHESLAIGNPCQLNCRQAVIHGSKDFLRCLLRIHLSRLAAQSCSIHTASGILSCLSPFMAFLLPDSLEFCYEGQSPVTAYAQSRWCLSRVSHSLAYSFRTYELTPSAIQAFQ